MRIVIYGAGGFGREVLRLALHAANGREVVFASDDPEQVGLTLSGRPVIASTAIKEDDVCTIAINDAATRRRLAPRCPAFINLVAPLAAVYPDVSIGEGAIICDFSSVTTDEGTAIGIHCHINTHATVAHDCRIGDFVTIGPGTLVGGNVILEDDVYIGCGAIIRNGSPSQPITVGHGAVVGMGAVVTRDIPPGATMVGNPARSLVRA